VLRTLAITQNVTVDGSIEMLGDWFDPQGQAGVDNSDLLEELHRQDSRADGFSWAERPSKICAATGPSSPTTLPASATTSTGYRSTSSAEAARSQGLPKRHHVLALRLLLM